MSIPTQHNRQASMSSEEFDPATPGIKWLQIHTSFLLTFYSSFPQKLRWNIEQVLRITEGNGIMLMSSGVVQAHCKSGRWFRMKGCGKQRDFCSKCKQLSCIWTEPAVPFSLKGHRLLAQNAQDDHDCKNQNSNLKLMSYSESSDFSVELNIISQPLKLRQNIPSGRWMPTYSITRRIES